MVRFPLAPTIGAVFHELVFKCRSVIEHLADALLVDIAFLRVDERRAGSHERLLPLPSGLDFIRDLEPFPRQGIIDWCSGKILELSFKRRFRHCRRSKSKKAKDRCY
jgi:hypothetical protein